jgi:hypothetical protein
MEPNMSQKRIAAQIVTVIYEDGTFRAEAARPGSPLRTKLELRDGLWEPEQRAMLLQISALNRTNREECEAIAAANKQQHDIQRANRIAREIYEHVSTKHSVKLANRCVPKLAAKAERKALKATKANGTTRARSGATAIAIPADFI